MRWLVLLLLLASTRASSQYRSLQLQSNSTKKSKSAYGELFPTLSPTYFGFESNSTKSSKSNSTKSSKGKKMSKSSNPSSNSTKTAKSAKSSKRAKSSKKSKSSMSPTPSPGETVEVGELFIAFDITDLNEIPPQEELDALNKIVENFFNEQLPSTLEDKTARRNFDGIEMVPGIATIDGMFLVIPYRVEATFVPPTSISPEDIFDAMDAADFGILVTEIESEVPSVEEIEAIAFDECSAEAALCEFEETMSPTHVDVTASPTTQPSSSPSLAPAAPTLSPTQTPTKLASTSPTQSPIEPSSSPSESPMEMASSSPSQVAMETSRELSQNPSSPDMETPSVSPSERPSGAGTALPSQLPSLNPSQTVSGSPSQEPSQPLTEDASQSPFGMASSTPSITTSASPSAPPSTTESQNPSSSPSILASEGPSVAATENPSSVPSQQPSRAEPVARFNTNVDTTNVPDNLRGAFTDAQARWDSIIVEDLPDVTITPGSIECPGATIPEVIDDVFICATIQTIDGVGGILGSAGPTMTRGNGLPISGSMQFDLADVQLLVDDGSFPNVILHEMAHVFGIGTLWERIGITGAGTDADPCDYRFPRATAEYQALSGCTTPIPVQLTGQTGTRCLHWDETCFGGELMTGFSTPPFQLSRITVAALEDIGYGVDYSLADPYPASELDASCRCGSLQEFEPAEIIAEDPSAATPRTGPQSVFPHRRRRRQLSQSGLQVATEYGKKLLAEKQFMRQNMTAEENEMYIGDKLTIVYYQEDGAIHGVEVVAD